MLILFLLDAIYYVLSAVMSFFFCKQKTAYERRISDWSSDVCSSDLSACSRRVPVRYEPGRPWAQNWALRSKRERSTGAASERCRTHESRALRVPVWCCRGDCTRLRRPASLCPSWAEIGSASCRGKVCQYVELSVAAV